MITAGRLTAITTVALALGFLGGVRFAGSETGTQLANAIAKPPAPAALAPPSPTPAPAAAAPSQPVAEPASEAPFEGGSSGLPAKTERTDLLTAPGCSWFIEPRPLPPDRSWVVTVPGIALYGDTALSPQTGHPTTNLVHLLKAGATLPELRPVYFDDAGVRYVPDSVSPSFSNNTAGKESLSRKTYRFIFDRFAPPPGSIVSFGVERVGPNAARLLSDAAQKAAKEREAAILPTPLINQPYEFNLTTVDGEPLRTQDFRGRPILIGVFLGPDPTGRVVANMLREVREAYRDGIPEFVCIFLDSPLDQARASLARAELGNTSLVLVPDDPALYRLWREGSQLIHGSHTCFLVDQNGVLRFAGSASELVANLASKNNQPIASYPITAFPFRPKVGPPRLQELAKKKAGAAPVPGPAMRKAADPRS